MSKRKTVPRCLVCEKPAKFISANKGYRKFCGSPCAKSPQGQQLRMSAQRQTLLKRYGVDSVYHVPGVAERRKETWNRLHGVDHPNRSAAVQEKRKIKSLAETGYAHHLSNPEIMEKRKRTLRERYGVDHAAKHADVQARTRTTCRRNHGVDNVFQCPEIKERIRKTNIVRYGVENVMQNADVFYRAHSKSRSLRRVRLGNSWVSCQGYEPFLLRDLLRTETPESILVGREIERVPYEWNGQRKFYFPDVSIGSCIYEVKSPHTFGVNSPRRFSILRAKADACRRLGMDFVCVVYDIRGNLLLKTRVTRSRRYYARLIAEEIADVARA